MDAQHDVRLLADRERHTPARPIAAVRDNHLAGLPLVPRQMFPAAAVGDLDLMQPACGQVLRQMQPPVIARPAGLAEAAGIDKHDASRRAEGQRDGRLGDGDQLAQEPQQPRVAGA